MLDRYTARALMDLGKLSSEEYLRLYGNELRAQREQARREMCGGPEGLKEADEARAKAKGATRR